jgi:rare lipoprotein A
MGTARRKVLSYFVQLWPSIRWEGRIMMVRDVSRRAAWLGMAALTLVALPLAARSGGHVLGSGVASYYANSFAGKRTASGEPYRPGALTAAHRSAPFGSRIRVKHLGNGREVVVRINDRGPWAKGRVIDLSYAAAKAIGLHRSGTARVSLTLVGN